MSLKLFMCQVTFTVAASDEMNAEIEANSAARWMKFDHPAVNIVSCGVMSEVIPNETAKGQ